MAVSRSGNTITIKTEGQRDLHLSYNPENHGWQLETGRQPGEMLLVNAPVTRLAPEVAAKILHDNQPQITSHMRSIYNSEIQNVDQNWFGRADAVTYDDAATLLKPLSLDSGDIDRKMVNAMASWSLNKSVGALENEEARRSRGGQTQFVPANHISQAEETRFNQEWARNNQAKINTILAQASRGQVPAPATSAAAAPQPQRAAPAASEPAQPAAVAPSTEQPDEAAQAASAAQATAQDVTAAENTGEQPQRAAPARSAPTGRVTPQNEIAETQALLSLAGFDAGPIDGIKGDRTERGMTAYTNTFSGQGFPTDQPEEVSIRAHIMSRLNGTSPEDIAFQKQMQENALAAIESGDAQKIKAAQAYMNVLGCTDANDQKLVIDGVKGSRTIAASEKLKARVFGPAPETPSAETPQAGAETPTAEAAPVPEEPPVKVLDGVKLGYEGSNGQILGASRNVEAWNAKPRDMNFYMANGGTSDNGVLSVSNKGQLIFAHNGQARDISELMLLDRKQTNAVTTFDRAKELGLNGTKIVFAPGSDMDEHYNVVFNKMRETHGANFDEKTGIAITMNVEAAGTDPQYTMRVFRGEDGKLQGQIVTAQNDANYQAALQQTPRALTGAIKSDQLDKFDYSRSQYDAGTFDMAKGSGQPAAEPPAAPVATAPAAPAQPAASPAPVEASAPPAHTEGRRALRDEYEHAGQPRERSLEPPCDHPDHYSRRGYGQQRDYGANPMARILRGPNDSLNEIGHGAARLGPSLVGGVLSGIFGHSARGDFEPRHDHREHHHGGYRTAEFDAGRDMPRQDQPNLNDLVYRANPADDRPAITPLNAPGRPM